MTAEDEDSLTVICRILQKLETPRRLEVLKGIRELFPEGRISREAEPESGLGPIQKLQRWNVSVGAGHEGGGDVWLDSEKDAKGDWVKWSDLVALFAPKPAFKHTMNDVYGDKSPHVCCEKCGFCVTCGDCASFGCSGAESAPQEKKHDS